MRIALDWDGTHTLDPDFWDAFARLAKQYGHEVALVTARGPGEHIEHFLPVVYCSRTPKRGHFAADVWIDDAPELI